MAAQVTCFFDEATFTITHVVADPASKACAIIDPVLDYDPKSGKISKKSADEVIAFVKGEGLTVEWILETHAHADHLTAAPYLKEKLGGKVGIGDHITEVQDIFKSFFNFGDDMATDGSQFDHLFKDHETFKIGALEGQVLHTPGHTPACIAYVVGDVAFVGDTIFMPDYGTARADFPGGDAATLYRSIKRILALPPETRLYMCHDYKAPGRDEYAWITTVGEEREKNVQIHDGVTEDEFTAQRKARDAKLDAPVLLLPSVQVNIRAGHLPPAEDNGVSYLKIPVREA